MSINKTILAKSHWSQMVNIIWPILKKIDLYVLHFSVNRSWLTVALFLKFENKTGCNEIGDTEDSIEDAKFDNFQCFLPSKLKKEFIQREIVRRLKGLPKRENRFISLIGSQSERHRGIEFVRVEEAQRFSIEDDTVSKFFLLCHQKFKKYFIENSCCQKSSSCFDYAESFKDAIA